MKTTTLPPLRVTSQLRKKIESVLDEGESLSAFMLDAVTHKAAVREEQRAFIVTARARAKAVQTQGSVSGAEVFARMEQVLARTRTKRTRR